MVYSQPYQTANGLNLANVNLDVTIPNRGFLKSCIARSGVTTFKWFNPARRHVCMAGGLRGMRLSTRAKPPGDPSTPDVSRNCSVDMGGSVLSWDPKQSSILDWDFPWNQPSSYWGIPMETSWNPLKRPTGIKKRRQVFLRNRKWGGRDV